MNIFSLGREKKKPRLESEMQYSLVKRRCTSKNKCASKHWNILPKWLWAFRFSMSSRDVRRQLEWLYRKSWLLHICGGSFYSVALFLFFSGFLSCWIEALIYLQQQSVHVSHVQVCPFMQHPSHYACMEVWCPSDDAHWSHICHDLGVVYTLWWKVNIFCLLCF